MEAMTKTSVLILLVAAAQTAWMYPAPAAAAEVYRWVDENGEVHYSESLPPDYKDKGHDVLNRDGLVVDENQTLTPPPPVEVASEDDVKELPRDASGMPRPKARYSEAEMQQRMDNFLMLRYDSEQEILDAMNVEIKQLNYDRRLLEGSLASTNEAYRGQLHLAADRQRAGLPVDDATSREIRKLRKELAKSSQSLDSLQQREDAIRTKFNEHLERYRVLVTEAAGDSAGN